MKKSDVIQRILGERFGAIPKNDLGKAFAPTNIALGKYWGKRNTELNLPVTSSLSISLGNKGATASLTLRDECDQVTVNGNSVALDSDFGKRLQSFLQLFRSDDIFFAIDIESTVPIAAGLASSACGFASLVKALDHLFGWELETRDLSILARLGSGSASRSCREGFVEWHAGVLEDGMDSYSEVFPETWPQLGIGLLLVSSKQKPLSSREAMQRTVATSVLYTAWPNKVSEDLPLLKRAILQKDFHLLGKTAESNALAMHATMQSAWPPIHYSLPETLQMMQKIWDLRAEGLPLYFTQDAGPNLKCIFLKKDEKILRGHFPDVEIIYPFLDLSRH